ncbi:MAG: AMP-binding protein, partial [Thermomicrobium sp.]|nr:AMP-binding protein [Thermomicrobium sp.]
MKREGREHSAWIPGEETISRSRLLAFMRRQGFDDLANFLKASTGDPEWFWRAVVDDLEVAFTRPFERVLDDSLGKPFPRWFDGGRINVAELCSHRHAVGARSSKTAVVYEGDLGQRRSLTYAQLDDEVRRFAANLRGLGVERGDRVVVFLPVIPEATVAFLACAMIGAISVPAFTGYGAEALAMRLRESEATVLVTADATTRRGRVVPLKETADAALGSAPLVRHVVVVRHLGHEIEMREGRDGY